MTIISSNSANKDNTRIISLSTMIELKKFVPPVLLKTVISCVIWYLVSSITSQLTKRILIEYSYPLFLSQFQFLTGSILSFIFIVMARKFPNIHTHFPTGSVPRNSTGPMFSLGAFLKILPLGLFQFGGKYCSLSATSLISLATVSSVKALSPLLIVIGYRLVYRVRFPLVTYLSLIPLVGGVILIVTSESPREVTAIEDTEQLKANQVKGLTFCFISAFIFAAQNIYGKQLITWDTDGSNPESLALDVKYKSNNKDDVWKAKKNVRQRTNSIKLPYSTSDLTLDEKAHSSQSSSQHYTEEINNNNRVLNNPFGSLVSESHHVTKPDKMTVIFYCSIIGFVISITGFVLNELPHLLDIFAGRLQESTPETKSGILVVFYLIMLSSISHFVQTLLAFHLLGSISAVSYSVASMMKRIVLIAISIVLALGDESDPNKYLFGKMSGSQLLGLGFIAIGLYCYDKWGSRNSKEKS